MNLSSASIGLLLILEDFIEITEHGFCTVSQFLQIDLHSAF